MCRMERCSRPVPVRATSRDSFSRPTALAGSEAATGEIEVRIAIGDEWIMFGSDGVFDSSRDGGALIAMVRGLESFGVDQFAFKNNRPDLLLQRLGASNAGLVE